MPPLHVSSKPKEITSLGVDWPGKCRNSEFRFWVSDFSQAGTHPRCAHAFHTPPDPHALADAPARRAHPQTPTEPHAHAPGCACEGCGPRRWGGGRWATPPPTFGSRDFRPLSNLKTGERRPPAALRLFSPRRLPLGKSGCRPCKKLVTFIVWACKMKQ